jgi:hypothetical protein
VTESSPSAASDRTLSPVCISFDHQALTAVILQRHRDVGTFRLRSIGTGWDFEAPTRIYWKYRTYLPCRRIPLVGNRRGSDAKAGKYGTGWCREEKYLR